MNNYVQAAKDNLEAIRQELADRFDEDFDCYSEDTDFCMRVKQAGWRIRYTPHATGIHDESQSSSSLKGQLIAHGNEVFNRKWKKWFEEHPV